LCIIKVHVKTLTPLKTIVGCLKPSHRSEKSRELKLKS
jgi:hypothetical protein